MHDAGASQISTSSSPNAPHGRTDRAIARKWVAGLLLVALAMVVAPAAASASPRGEQVSSLTTFSDLETVPGAVATLDRSADSVRTTVDTAGLDRGHVMTLWWVIFNNPEECGDGAGPCGVADLFDPDVGAGCLFGDGGTVVGHGGIRLRNTLHVGDDRDSCLPFFGAVDHGLIDPEGAEIHLVVRSHGPRIPREYRAQRSSFVGGCDVFGDQGAVADDPGECADQQFALFPPAN